ncbi:MAG: hypothetical protein KIT61_03305 [Pyrinomonadaceae bacterium]|nr:hypothetical protein [Pyrinomonadaceae bacterium]
MQTNRQITFGSRMVISPTPVVSERAEFRRKFWSVVMAVSFVSGLMLGISGLVFSLLTACEIVANTRSLSLTVTSLIVASLGLLLFGAHAMDRMDEESRKSPRNSDSNEL